MSYCGFGSSPPSLKSSRGGCCINAIRTLSIIILKYLDIHHIITTLSIFSLFININYLYRYGTYKITVSAVWYSVRFALSDHQIPGLVFVRQRISSFDTAQGSQRWAGIGRSFTLSPIRNHALLLIIYTRECNLRDAQVVESMRTPGMDRMCTLYKSKRHVSSGYNI